MLAAIADGATTIAGANGGEDVLATARALAALGVDVVRTGASAFAVVGAGSMRDPAAPIDCGNSGTTMRLLAGLLAGRVNATLDGDRSLRSRPMARVLRPLRAMGARIDARDDALAPLTLFRSAQPLRGAVVEPDAPSAQVKSAVLLAGTRADGETIVVERVPTRDHTERMLAAMGAKIRRDAERIAIQAGPLRALGTTTIPGDLSSAFFFIAAAVALPGARARVERVGVNPTRMAAIEIARSMGADIRIADERTEHGEPVADIEAVGGSPLRGAAIAASVVPNLIDEIPALCALGAIAHGGLRVSGASELRAKESDRIETTASLLAAFGAEARPLPDGIVVTGGARLRPPASVTTHGDHRIGMTAAILAAAAGAPLRIDDAACIATSFPGFEETWNSAFA